MLLDYTILDQIFVLSSAGSWLVVDMSFRAIRYMCCFCACDCIFLDMLYKYSTWSQVRDSCHASKWASAARDLQDVSASALALLAAGGDQLTAARRSPYNLIEWPTSSRRTPPTTKPRPAFTNHCLLPTHSRPVAVCLCFCLAHHKYRLLISSLLGLCPALPWLKALPP
jgi:hypothetical protein